MDTLHPIMASALGGFRPHTPAPDVPAEQRVIDLQRRLDRLLHTPFMLEVETRAAITHLAPEDCTEPEYVEIEISPKRVEHAVEQLIDNHMSELELILTQLISQETPP